VAGNLVPGDNEVFTISGRCDYTNRNEVSFDWPGITITFGLTGTSCAAVIYGPCMFDLFIDNQFVNTISAADKKDILPLAHKLTNNQHIVKLVKRNETVNKPVVFYGVIIDTDAELFHVAQKITRKIEFIGDSYTAGYANEFLFRECKDEDAEGIVFSTTNARLSFANLIAGSFNAERYINAISGKGIVRNYGWSDIGSEFLRCYGRTLLTSVSNPAVNGAHWNYAWHPDVIVIGLGINDFQADPPYADSLQFDSTYTMFVTSLKEQHPGVKIICCATKIWPANLLIPRVRGIVESFREKGDNGIFYFEYETENTALYGHPSINDHQKIAQELGAFIGYVTGWK
jgi:hypothetical protein